MDFIDLTLAETSDTISIRHSQITAISPVHHEDADDTAFVTYLGGGNEVLEDRETVLAKIATAVAA